MLGWPFLNPLTSLTLPYPIVDDHHQYHHQAKGLVTFVKPCLQLSCDSCPSGRVQPFSKLKPPVAIALFRATAKAIE